MERLRATVTSRGLTIFALIDFRGDSERAGLKMLPTQLLKYWESQSWDSDNGCDPTSAIDFPLKILVSQDEIGRVGVSYNSADYLKARHNIPEDLLKNISGVAAIAESVAK